MKSAKTRFKKKICREHREWMYGQALDELMTGQVKNTEYCTYRWRKLKQVRGKR